MIELKTKSPDMENHIDIGAVLMSFISIVAVFPNVSVRVKCNVFEPP
jgi:capsid portal protein